MNDMLFRVNVWIRPEFCPFYIFFDDVGDILGYIVVGYGGPRNFSSVKVSKAEFGGGGLLVV